jgi:hypothetical protein
VEGGGRSEKSRPLSRQLRAALSGVSASVGRAAARPSARESAIDEKQKDRSRNRSEPGAEVKELVDRISEAERLDDQPADECADDPNQRCDDETPGIVSDWISASNGSRAQRDTGRRRSMSGPLRCPLWAGDDSWKLRLRQRGCSVCLIPLEGMRVLRPLIRGGVNGRRT